MKILFTTVCNDEYAIGGHVMLYSMRKYIKNFDQYDVNIYYNNEFASLSQKNQDTFKLIFPNVRFVHVNKECYFNSKLPPAGNRAQGCKAAYLTLESFQEIDYDKVIMFDVDMLCIDDISELFDSNIQFGIHHRNTGFVVLGNRFRNQQIYEMLTNNIYSHDGQFMDQGIINNLLGQHFETLPRDYNCYPLSLMDQNSKILHWAHYDHIKPWVVDEWKDKVELFQDVPAYPYPNKKTGNIPVLQDKPAFDKWNDIKHDMDKDLI